MVKSRVFKLYVINETNGKKELIDSYTETGAEIGRHDQGTDALTIDDLYDSCASEYLIVDKTNNTIHFETTTNGLMTLCGFIPDDCIDDCFRGVRINFFKWTDD